MIPRSSNGDSSGSSSGGEGQRQRQHGAAGPAQTPFPTVGGTAPSTAAAAASQPHHQAHSSISSTFSATSSSKETDNYNNPQGPCSTQQLDPYALQQLEQQQLLQYQQQLEQQQQQQATIPRSSPIAIVRSLGDGEKGIKRRDSDSDREDEDDDDSEIDVEKDAIKLQKKYGATIVQTYQATTSTDQLLKQQSRKNGSVLNAPYLGSLSRSANQVLSLPPMSLAGATVFAEPPETITSYGSLRDSQERGRFLDGPSSYREPTSGRIRQLDHRLRYHGRSSELSIGERMQQSRKLKEIRQKEQAKKKEGSNEATGTGGSSNDQKSGLSAMLNEVSKQNVSLGNEANIDIDTSSYGEEILMPIKTGDVYETPTFRDNDLFYINETMMDAPSMLSTSLTAFEMLKMSNLSASMPSGQSGTAASANFASLAPPPAGVEEEDQRRFQPLARSMSDPTPHLRQLSLRDNNQQGLTQDASHSAATTNTRAPGIGWANDPRNSGMQMMPPQYPPEDALDTAFDYAPQPSANATDHDPDTEGAFGDMDME